MNMDYQRVYAKIDLDAIEHNIALVKQKIAANTKLMLEIGRASCRERVCLSV